MPTIFHVYCAFVNILWSDVEHDWILRLIRGRLFIYSQPKERFLSPSKDSRTLGFSAISLLVSALDGHFVLLNDIYRRVKAFPWLRSYPACFSTPRRSRFYEGAQSTFRNDIYFEPFNLANPPIILSGTGAVSSFGGRIRERENIKHSRITVHSVRLISLSFPSDGGECCENKDTRPAREGTRILVSRSFQTMASSWLLVLSYRPRFCKLLWQKAALESECVIRLYNILSSRLRGNFTAGVITRRDF